MTGPVPTVVLVAGLLIIGGLFASAAEPGGPDQLPKQVIGVTGSGDNLVLNLTSGESGMRTLHIGDIYADGWILRSLSPVEAVLTRGQESRTVGLNPSGEVGDTPNVGRPSQVVILLSEVDQEYLKREISLGRWDVLAHWGMTLDETSRLIAYDAHRVEGFSGWYAKNWVAGFRASQIPGQPTVQSVMGAAYDDYLDLARKRIAYQADHLDAELAENPITGPNSFYLPADRNARDLMVEQGIDPRGTWSLGPADEQGGRTDTRVAPADFINTWWPLPAETP